MNDSSSHTVLDLVADPGLPAEPALRLTRELPEHLRRNGDGEWEVRLSEQALRLTSHHGSTTRPGARPFSR